MDSASRTHSNTDISATGQARIALTKRRFSKRDEGARTRTHSRAPRPIPDAAASSTPPSKELPHGAHGRGSSVGVIRSNSSRKPQEIRPKTRPTAPNVSPTVQRANEHTERVTLVRSPGSACPGNPEEPSPEASRGAATRTHRAEAGTGSSPASPPTCRPHRSAAAATHRRCDHRGAACSRGTPPRTSRCPTGPPRASP